MQLSGHFSLTELTASDTALAKHIDNSPAPFEVERLRSLAGHMEAIRTILGDAPIKINSAFRSEALNKAVGGVADSDHRLCYACDFKPLNMSVYEACKRIANSGIAYDQLINERNMWVHISFNPRGRHQNLRAVIEGGKTAYKAGY